MQHWNRAALKIHGLTDLGDGRRILTEVLQPRAEEIFHLVWDEIRREGYEKSLNSGIVLTGGGAILDGMPEIAEQIFDLPIRRGCPTGIGGLADHVNSPAFATGVGLVMYAHRNHAGEPARPVGEDPGRLEASLDGHAGAGPMAVSPCRWSSTRRPGSTS